MANPNLNLVLPAPGTSLFQGETDIATPSTAVIVIPATNEPSLAVMVRAKSGNAAVIYIGGSGVSTDGSDGFPILPGDTWRADVDHKMFPLYINAGATYGCHWQILVA